MNFRKHFGHCLKNGLALFFFAFPVFSAKFFPEESFEAKRISPGFSYFGFPMSAFVGFDCRKNDFELLVPLGFEMDMDSGFQVFAFSGIQTRFKNFYAVPKVKYELYGAGTKPFSDKTEFSAELELGYKNRFGKVGLGSVIGRKRWRTKPCGFQEAASAENEGEFTWNENVKFSFLLFDNLIFKATGEAKASLNVLPESKFSSYDFVFSLPFQISWHYGESAFLYNLFFTDYLNVFGNENRSFETGKTYSAFTKRISAADASAKDCYRFFTSLETEQRFYLCRLFNETNSFFLSLFANASLGLNEGNRLDFLYQYGIGVGYNLYGCVPFTFQVGFDNKNSLVMYVGIVSRIIHGM